MTPGDFPFYAKSPTRKLTFRPDGLSLDERFELVSAIQI